MKKCPNCQSTFDDTMNFCQFDAAPLVPVTSGDDLPPTVIGFQPPPTQMASSQQFEKPTHPQMPAFQTSQPIPQFQRNQPSPAPSFNPQFNIPGASASAQSQLDGKRPGNRWAMAGLGFLIAACVLTFLAFGFGSFRGLGNGLGYGSIEGYNMRYNLLPIITIFVTIIAFAFAALALLMKMTNPGYYGRRNSALAVLLVSMLLFAIQLILTANGYSAVSKYSSGYNTAYNSLDSANSGRTNVSNTAVINRPSNIPSAPVPLSTAIIGTWRDSVGATVSFYADKTLVINDKSGKKIADADYEITGTNKLAMIKNRVRVKEYDIYVSGSRMTMDGETMTKVY